MSNYLVLQQADGVYRQVAHPGYLDANGELAGHNLLAERGYYQATDVKPGFDARFEEAVRQPSDQWTFDHTAKTCTVTYTVAQKDNAFAEYKATARKRVDGILAVKLRQGATVTVEGVNHVIQTRHTLDNVNLLSVHSKASARAARGDTTPCVVRTQANEELVLAPADMVTTLETVFDIQEGVYQDAWGAKATIEQVTEGTDIVAALDAIDSALSTFEAA